MIFFFSINLNLRNIFSYYNKIIKMNENGKQINQQNIESKEHALIRPNDQKVICIKNKNLSEAKIRLCRP